MQLIWYIKCNIYTHIMSIDMTLGTPYWLTIPGTPVHMLHLYLFSLEKTQLTKSLKSTLGEHGYV